MTCVYGAVGRPRKAQTSSLRILCLVNCWQTAVQDSVRHFFRLKLEKALAFIWPIFSEPIWLEDAVLHRGWEGEKPKNSVPLGRRGYAPSRKKPGLWKMEGERKTRFKGVGMTERESEEERLVDKGSEENLPSSMSLLYHSTVGQEKTRTTLTSGSTVHDLFLSDLFVRSPYHLLEHYSAVKPVLSSKTPPIKQQDGFPWKKTRVSGMQFFFYYRVCNVA